MLIHVRPVHNLPPSVASAQTLNSEGRPRAENSIDRMIDLTEGPEEVWAARERREMLAIVSSELPRKGSSRFCFGRDDRRS